MQNFKPVYITFLRWKGIKWVMHQQRNPFQLENRRKKPAWKA